MGKASDETKQHEFEKGQEYVNSEGRLGTGSPFKGLETEEHWQDRVDAWKSGVASVENNKK